MLYEKFVLERESCPFLSICVSLVLKGRSESLLTLVDPMQNSIQRNMLNLMCKFR
jgi:hypothetical protein